MHSLGEYNVTHILNMMLQAWQPWPDCMWN